MARRSRGQRIGSFKGNLSEYSKHLEQVVYYLEAQVRYLQEQVQFFCQQAGHLYTVPVQYQPSTQQLPDQCQPSTQQLPGRFVFQLETPETQAGKATKPSIEPWKAATREFLSQVPKDEDEWLAKRKEVRLHEPDAVIHTFCLFTRRSPQVYPLKIGNAPGGEASILDVLGDYRGFANALGVHRTYAIQISYYSTLLFVGLCIVALRTGTNPEVVDDHMRKFLTEQQGKECTAGETYLSQLRTGALWTIKRMDELYETALKHRGWEIFLLCSPSIHSYRKLSKCEGTEKFTSEVAICEPPEEGEVQADIPFHITFLIKVILGNRRSLGQINEALGTRLHQKTFNAWAYAAWRRIDSLLRIRCRPRARKRRRVSHDDEICEGWENSSTEASSDGDVCFTPKTTAADSTQDDDLGGMLDQLQRALIIDTPPDHTNGQRDASEHGSSGQDGASEATGRPALQVVLDDERPSTYVADFRMHDGRTLAELDLFSEY
ncbi:hypothetical protein K469DRAFT_690714 [Zopfia rhizophila CBS 207.26]|uniref:Uncharacterized protein n=1 Tax=Zopfia rhizophila CBS 207.26 TaxID=1314779 RepID=A0A6A6DWI9_9PEZI|nr:hypothetical protein K469DRAFT_690714 [Zopfia rhizophila CBS 207.26]